MYVVSTFRSGGTAFCLKHAFDNKLTYGGELDPLFINAFGKTNAKAFVNYKSFYHETGVQPTYTARGFVEQWKNLNDPNTVYLLPASQGIPFLRNASHVITRKNIRKMIASFINYNLKASNFVSTSSNTQYIYSSLYAAVQRELQLLACMLDYCNMNDKPITWYEDNFDRDTEYALYNKWDQKKNFEKAIEFFLQNIPLSAYSKEIVV